jgi:hypothetical protein
MENYDIIKNDGDCVSIQDRRMDVWRSVYNIQDSKLYMIVPVRQDPFVLNISHYVLGRMDIFLF